MSKHSFCFLSFHPEECPHQRHKCFITPLSVHSSCEAGTINPAFNVIDIGFAFNLFHYTDHEIRNVPILIDLDFQTQRATMRWKELERREPRSHEITWGREGKKMDVTSQNLNYLKYTFWKVVILFHRKLSYTFLLSEYCLKGGGELSRCRHTQLCRKHSSLVHEQNWISIALAKTNLSNVNPWA